MEALYFTFGVLSVILITLSISVVYSIVKVVKQKEDIRDLQQSISLGLDKVDSDIQAGSRELYEVQRMLEQQLAETYRALNEQIKAATDKSESHTDMRVDKLEAKLTSKQLSIN
jgi:hypothetical protein